MRVESSVAQFSRDAAPVASEAAQTTTAAVARASKQTDISVVTTEGDRVTISAGESTTVAFAGYGADGRLTSGLGYVSSSRSATFSVEGDLSRHELRDLRKIVHAVGKPAASGDSEKLEHRLSRPDLSTVESVGASVTYERFAVARTATVPPADTTADSDPAAPSESTPSADSD